MLGTTQRVISFKSCNNSLSTILIIIIYLKLRKAEQLVKGHTESS